MKNTAAIATALILLASGTALLAAPSYIGVARCKLCHKVEFNSWQTMAHAKAFELLQPEEQGNEECLKCHATGATAELPGVQCEACHGPGSDYKSMTVMKDREASVAAGLVIPDQVICESCHTGAPHDQPAFDFDAVRSQGIHEFKKPD